jgi:hypothetical protein
MPDALACLADGLTPSERHEILLETFADVSRGRPAMEAVCARQEVIGTIAGELARFYLSWEKENPQWFEQRPRKFPPPGHTLSRVAAAFSRTSPLECQWLFHVFREKADPAYCHPDASMCDLSSGLEEKMGDLLFDLKKYGPTLHNPNLPRFPSQVFEKSFFPGVTHGLWLEMSAENRMFEESIASMVSVGDWEGAWEKIWTVQSKEFDFAMKKMAEMPYDERAWDRAVRDGLDAMVPVWGTVEGFLRYFPGPRKEMAEWTVARIVDEATRAYEPSQEALFRAVATWELTREMGLARFMPDSDNMQDAWGAVAPLLEKEGLDSRHLQSLLIDFEEALGSTPASHRMSIEESFLVWESDVLKKRLEGAIEGSFKKPARQRL